ncbi:MAG: hypothetical protein MPEBLZ_00691 [Candidatus Methanoperedens nitroreducens]|uniref:Uncharacterized protein n=1 Tax=Candidatus Methanoperedens nitratireducens TaxID=1392998 RepID=A0A0P8E2X2_9EURY|nr:hypothetical protein [Candidatus Methanoperedens sp. BLZ2]KAB2942721.1 MAG: hypothetical protein F9K14_16775 [Candidatus Methanoperedens sp.]KPQ44726.1 MAG: hypothetical protein MPEBLZ_00691 [Candidatus Methanoperedens sp. BLZ1]MBZ0175361.1 hypothetical protein [Candidatus Methanoperedens nitroreducens]CAG1002894.1 hypothetical protein METP2_03423 [Methanosarcinales archaeon]MCX9079503.1 hypothetical protein [Candidatus Methanoperedens sp.]
MVALTTVDDQHINDLFDDLQKLVLKKKSEDVIKDALSEMVVKYGRFTKENARGILNSRISGKLSDTVTELRNE